MRPTTSLGTQRPDLESLIEFDAEMSYGGFIGWRVMPLIPVYQQAGVFGRVKADQILQYLPDLVRAPGTGFSRQRTGFESDTFACTNYGHEEPIDDYEAAMFANYGNSEQIALTRVVDTVLRAAEQRVATLVQGAGVTSQAASGVWTSNAGSPIGDIKTARNTIRNATGVAPDTLAIDWFIFQGLINHDEIVNRVKYNGFMDARPGNITTQALAQCLNLKQVLVAGDGAMARQSDATLSQIWTKTIALVFKAAQTNDIREPCLGRTFHYQVNGDRPVAVETYRQEEIKSDVVRAETFVHEKLVYPSLAIKITGAGS